jgi:hypothetical protein
MPRRSLLVKRTALVGETLRHLDDRGLQSENGIVCHRCESDRAIENVRGHESHLVV